MGDLFKNLGINWTVVAVQAAVFFLLFLVMSRLLFGRILDHLKKRDEETQAALAKVAERQAEVDRLKAEYEEKLRKIEKEAQEKLQAAVKEGVEIRNRIQAEAEAERRKELEQAKARIAQERDKALAELRAETARMAGEIAERVLAEPVPAPTREKSEKDYFKGSRA